MAKVLVGSKVQVFRGIAVETSGGLKKKDIVKVKDSNGVTHYKSKKQQANGSSKNKKSQKSRQKWTNAYKKAIKQLREEDDYYTKNGNISILLFNPAKTYKGYTKQQISKGNKLYKLTKELYGG